MALKNAKGRPWPPNVFMNTEREALEKVKGGWNFS